MKSREVMFVLKKVVVGSLVMAVALTSFSATSKAEESNVGEIVYESMAMKDYYGEKEAPLKKGYVFAGWYSDNKGAQVATEAQDTAYAKFVPAEVLSVKTQASKGNVEDKTTDTVETGQTLRILSSVDSTRYQKVGFRYMLGANKTEKSVYASTSVYSKLVVVGEDAQLDTRTPAECFGSQAKYFFAADIVEIAKENYSNQIYVQPYWVTLDGTTVYGQASNVFLEDHCADKNYYRASVNLFGDQDVAAGKVTVTYNSDQFEVVDVVNGRLFKGEIESNKDTVGTVTIVGNASKVNEHEKASDLLMTVRFTKKSGVTDNLKFTNFESQFCDWNEEDVTGIVVQ